MRAAFMESLLDAARQDERIFLLIGDIGYHLVEPFAEEFPERFVNIGIAEQNMVGIATGLALSGKTVFTYSIANFPTARCIEQIRNDVCFHKADVKIVTAGGGLIYGALGTTHHLTEDVALMRALPNMTVITPGDPVEAGLATRALAGAPGPGYLRLGRTADPTVHREAPEFVVGRAIAVRQGADITLIASGGILPNAVAAADAMKEKGIAAGVISMPTVKPIDREAVVVAASGTGGIVTIEEHSIIGGLGSAVAEVLAEDAAGVPFLRMGLPDEFCREVGDQAYLRNIYSLSIEGIVDTVSALLERRKR